MNLVEKNLKTIQAHRLIREAKKRKGMTELQEKKLAESKAFVASLDKALEALANAALAVPESLNDETQLQLVFLLGLSDIGSRIMAMSEGISQGIAKFEAGEVVSAS